MVYDRIIAFNNSITVYRHGDKCIKRYAPPHTPSAVYLEAFNMAKVKQLTSLLVPKVYGVAQSEEYTEIMTEYIEGKTLAQILLSNPCCEQIVDDFIKIQLSVHAHSSPFLNGETPNNQPIDLFACENKVLCHGNFSLENIIQTENGNFYIIGWQNAFFANAEKDCAITYMLLKYQLNDDIAENYLQKYCAIRQIDSKAVTSEREWAINFLITNSIGRRKKYFQNLIK